MTDDATEFVHRLMCDQIESNEFWRNYGTYFTDSLTRDMDGKVIYVMIDSVYITDMKELLKTDELIRFDFRRNRRILPVRITP